MWVCGGVIGGTNVRVASIVTGRFWQEESAAHLKSPQALLSNYLTSVGRAANLILNMAPDDTGAVPEVDMQRYAQLGNDIKALFSKPLAATVSANRQFGV